ncbi:MAG: YeeE/YedE family protein [Rhodospirillales bacterium]|nr:YeeE/YedE family protein [Rhodospirillales bacterium]
MDGLSAASILGLGGFVVGLAYGAVVQRTDFCTMGAVSDIVLMGDYRRFRAWLAAIAVALLGTQALSLAGAVDIERSMYLTPRLGWLGAVLGGLLFGFGMTLTGGCISKNIVRLGGGNLKSLVVIMVTGVFAYMAIRGLFAPLRLSLEQASAVDLRQAGIRSQGLPAILAAAVPVPPSTLAAVLTVLVAGALAVFCFRDARFRASPVIAAGGVGVGLLVAAGFFVTGVLARDDFEPVRLASLTFVAPAGEALVYLMTFTGAAITFGIAAVAGGIVGGFLVAIARGTFRLETFANVEDTIRHLVGAALMGIGGVLALGCSIGQGVTGVSTLSLQSWIAFASIIIGATLGIKFLEEGSLRGALRALVARRP